LGRSIELESDSDRIGLSLPLVFQNVGSFLTFVSLYSLQDLCGTSLGLSQDILEFCRSLRFSSLKSLKLSCNHLNDSAGKELAASLALIPEPLECLLIHNNPMKTETLDALLSALESSKRMLRLLKIPTSCLGTRQRELRTRKERIKNCVEKVIFTGAGIFDGLQEV
jgi:hypothetical protein